MEQGGFSVALVLGAFGCDVVDELQLLLGHFFCPVGLGRVKPDQREQLPRRHVPQFLMPFPFHACLATCGFFDNDVLLPSSLRTAPSLLAAKGSMTLSTYVLIRLVSRGFSRRCAE